MGFASSVVRTAQLWIHRGICERGSRLHLLYELLEVRCAVGARWPSKWSADMCICRTPSGDMKESALTSTCSQKSIVHFIQPTYVSQYFISPLILSVHTQVCRGWRLNSLCTQGDTDVRFTLRRCNHWFARVWRGLHLHVVITRRISSGRRSTLLNVQREREKKN